MQLGILEWSSDKIININHNEVYNYEETQNMECSLTGKIGRMFYNCTLHQELLIQNEELCSNASTVYFCTSFNILT